MKTDIGLLKSIARINFERLKKALTYIKKLIDSDNNAYLTNMIDINNMITGSNNITLRNVNVKPW